MEALLQRATQRGVIQNSLPIAHPPAAAGQPVVVPVDVRFAPIQACSLPPLFATLDGRFGNGQKIGLEIFSLISTL
jgi:hypothetical protein